MIDNPIHPLICKEFWRPVGFLAPIGSQQNDTSIEVLLKIYTVCAWYLLKF